MKKHIALLAPVVLAISACATTGPRSGPTDVVRYHLNQPIAPGTVAVEPFNGAAQISPEYQLYADAVAAELSRLGFTPAPAGTPSQYFATVGFNRASRGEVRTPPRFSIGIGGGSFGGGRGGGVGLGGGVSTGIGGKTLQAYSTELAVQIKRRSDGTIVWEGRAQRPSLSGPDEQPTLVAGRMANALFQGFPGESGITTTVK
ncbi:hypothetical protein ASE86_12115 [Sphingomonas sp. Leaf33]|uniref:DUF4136 domain-containing protein n=1 Tax=Sphingomonas sp. Leaf33 TaxID=1736215 RepID=UPI0006F9C57E|nr:DUF4136 domain-containing protein [Sphingomonas sp. Leaf33]KQN19254.1 hypothetical protein ASE86_12115 [Sphingomonas sp. Leaf33]